MRYCRGWHQPAFIFCFCKNVPVPINLCKLLNSPKSRVFPSALNLWSNSFSHSVSTHFCPARYDIFSVKIQPFYLSAGCLQAEDDSGTYPSYFYYLSNFHKADGCFRAGDERDLQRHTRCVGSAWDLTVCFSLDLDEIQVCPLSSFSILRVWYVSHAVFPLHISASHNLLSLVRLSFLSLHVGHLFLFPSNNQLCMFYCFSFSYKVFSSPLFIHQLHSKLSFLV